MPGVRKRRVGEAKASNVDAGVANSLCLSLYSVSSVQGFDISSVNSLSCCCELGREEDADGNGLRDGFMEVATCVQSNIPSRTTRPAMLTGTFFEALVSVSASEVASVPPRWEP